MKKSLPLVVLLLATAPAAFAADRSVQLVVEGMECAACPITVRKVLERIEGVKVTRIDARTSTMSLVVSNDAVTDLDLAQATANAGYPSRIRKEIP